MSLNEAKVDETLYARLAREAAELVESKQAAYGDSFGKSGAIMRILYPEGIPLTKLDDALTVVRVLDKLFRIATDRDALGESPWKDILGYALLAARRVALTAQQDTGRQQLAKLMEAERDRQQAEYHRSLQQDHRLIPR